MMTLELDTLQLAVLGIFALCFLIQLYYTLVIQRKLAVYKHVESETVVQHPVSVIVCARNERANLEQFLPAILAQNYPNFEVVVVNDRSTDESEFLLRDLAAQYKHLKVVTINADDRFKQGKKFAVTMGVKAANNEWLLFTDADCTPSSDQWLAGMQAHFNGNAEIVIGYSPYYKKRGLVNALIRYETLQTAISYLSLALHGMPYMGVGRNMAYRKSLFFKSKGFASHLHIPSGDDDLFVNENATPNNTLIEIGAQAQVWSEPKLTFAEYMTQKKRHFGAGKVYKSAHKRVLGLQVLSILAFYICFVVLLALKVNYIIVLGVFFTLLLIRTLVFRLIFKRLSYGDLIYWFPILDIIFYPFLCYAAVVSRFSKNVTWK